MAFTQADLDRINTAIASGVTTVSINGRSTSFRTLKEMIETRNLIQAELGTAKERKPHLFNGFDKGYRA